MIKQVIQKGCEKLDELEKQHAQKDRKKEELPSQAQGTREVPGALNDQR